MEQSRHDEKAIAFFGTWALFGLYLDGWAHIHNKPETFFSPWHGVLYSSVGVAVAYFGFREYILRRPSATTDRLLTLGFVIFGAGAVGDFIWHEIFGIEVDIEALLSPTHLLLLTGGVLMLGFGYRQAIARNEPRETTFFRFFPTAMSLTLAGALAMFFTQYFAAHQLGRLFYDRAIDNTELFAIHAIGSVFVTNAILMGVTLLAVRRWDTRVGTFALIYGLIVTAVTGLLEFESVLHVPAAIAAGLAVDILAGVLRPSPERRRQALAFAGLAPLFIWVAWVGAVQAMGGVHWPAELWTGTIFLAILEGVGLGLLAFAIPGVDTRPAAADPAAEIRIPA